MNHAARCHRSFATDGHDAPLRSKRTSATTLVFLRSFNLFLALTVVLGLVVQIAFVTLVKFPGLSCLR